MNTANVLGLKLWRGYTMLAEEASSVAVCHTLNLSGSCVFLLFYVAIWKISTF